MPTPKAHLSVLNALGLLEQLSVNESACSNIDDVGAQDAIFCSRLTRYHWLSTNNNDVGDSEEQTGPATASRMLVTFLEPGPTPDTSDALRIDSVDSLATWLALRGRVPHYSSGDATIFADQRYKAIGAAQFRSLKQQVKVASSDLQRDSLWLDSKSPRIGDLDRPIFVQKVVVEQPDKARVYLIGDLHSSLDSLLNILERMKRNNAFADNFTLAPHRYIVFLGDVVDRGPYSVELLTLVFKLQLANPERVFFINGNHEDCQTYSRDGGLMSEVRGQFFASGAPLQPSERSVLEFTGILHYLPSAIVMQIGGDVYQLCHGAMTEHASEQRKIKALIDDRTGKRFAFLRNWLDNQVCYPHASVEPDNLKWGDFDGAVEGVVPNPRDRSQGGMKIFGWRATQRYLQALGLTAIISGHQDFSNFTMLIAPSRASSDVLNVLVEPDANYSSLYRPKNYANLDLDAQFIVFEPGRDFLACNTSSALAAKRNDQGLRYDCFLTLFASKNK